MSTSILNCEVELSRQIADYWASTSTSTGTSTTIVDTELKAFANDWIDGDKQMYDMITSGTYDEQERKISSLDNSTGTLTVLAHGGAIASSVTYRVHRLFKASDKRIALVNSAKLIYPHCFKQIRDESIVSGNWLKDGSLEIWTDANTLTYWTASGVTLTKTTTSGQFKHGKAGCKISGAGTGYVDQDIVNWDDLKHLAGKTVTFTLQARCDTASSLRIGVLYDGTNLSYSDHHDGDDAWTEHNDPLEVEVTIDDNPTDIGFRIYHDVAGTTSYVDDARVIWGEGNRLYIGNLGLAQNEPHQVLIEPNDYSQEEPWDLIHGITYDQTNGYMYLPDSVSRDYRLRILGIGYLDFYDTSDVVGTDWDDTIALDHPQTEILVAQAALYLYQNMSMPNFDSGTREEYMQLIGYWEQQLAKRIGKFAMDAPSATVHWR